MSLLVVGSYSLPACSPTTQEGGLIYQPMPIQESQEQPLHLDALDGSEVPVAMAAPVLIPEGIDGQGNLDLPGYRSPIAKQNVFRDGKLYLSVV